MVAFKVSHGQRVRSLSSRLPLAGWALIAYVAVFSAFNWLAPPDLEGRNAIIDAGQIVTATCAAFLCVAASRSASDARGRRSWMLFAAAFAVTALGESLWAYFEIIMGDDLPSPSIADIAYGLMYPLAFIALMLQAPHSETRFGKITSSLDALLFSLGSGALIWHFVLGPALLANDDPLLALVSSFYPLGDVLLVLAISSLLLRLPLERVPRYSLPLVGA